MKKYSVFLKGGSVEHINATDMRAALNSLRFFNGKKLVAIFEFAQIRKAGESGCFPEQNIDADALSEERLNGWLARMKPSN